MLGMRIAIGELQKHAGSDQRVTVPATTVFPNKDFDELYDADIDDGTTGRDDMWEIYRANAAMSSSRSYLTTVETYLTPQERANFNDEINDWWNTNDYNPHWTGVFDSVAALIALVTPLLDLQKPIVSFMVM